MNIPHRMENWQFVIRELMAQSGLKQTLIAAELGVTQGTVSKWLQGSVPDDASREKIAAFRRRLKGEPEAREPSWTVRVIGRIGAGARIEPEVEQLPPDGLFEVRVPFPVPPESKAFEVQGDSMWPRYQAGDIIVCWQQFADPRELIGGEAVVQTIEGHRFLKHVMAGKKKATFDLRSHNAPEMFGVRLEWAARIGVIVPRGSWTTFKRSSRNGSS